VSEVVDVVIGVIVTQREQALARLLASLEAVMEDTGVHVVILENSEGEQRARAHAHAASFGARCAGEVRVVDANPPRRPLHEARALLTRELLAFASASLEKPIVWMIDDDVTFEKLVLSDGALSLQETAREHIAQVRAWSTTTDASFIVGHFTGDPPIRPEATLATQLGDLCANLEQMRSLTPDSPWHPDISPGLFQGDYYYDHAEATEAHLRHTFPWIRRSGSRGDVRNQLLALCEASLTIGRGATPFRPMIASKEALMLTPTTSPLRGGNTIFFDLDVLASHSYPAVLIDGRWSRRADMIGATLVARRPGVIAYHSTLSLHHDRSDQHLIDAATERWVPEFCGVLLARLVMNPSPANKPRVGALAELGELARERAERITSRLTLARARASRALSLTTDIPTWWREDAQVTVSVHALRTHITHIHAVLIALEEEDLLARLTSPALLEHIARGYEELLQRPLVTSMNAQEAV
jgi:hypothetical protein